MRGRRNVFLILSIFVFVSAVLFALWYFDTRKPQVQSPHRKIDHVILVTIDTLRADHVGAYGYPIDTTPFLDRIAKKGILFKNTTASIPSTTPSHASIFTSLYPLQHGILKNGHKLDQRFTTMAEVFREMGYKTAGIVSTNSHFLTADVHQGFQYFNEPGPADVTGFKFLPRSLKRLQHAGIPHNLSKKLESLKYIAFRDPDSFLNRVRTQIGGKALFQYKTLFLKYCRADLKYRIATDTIDNAIKWLDSLEPGEKAFLWIHLFDPHGPLQPTEFHLTAIKKQSTEFSSDGHSFYNFLTQQQHIEPGFFTDKADLLNRILLYDAEIQYADRQLQRFFTECQNRGLDENSLWIFTADHGQGLGNHFYWQHGHRIYNEQVRVPMIFYFSGDVSSHNVVDHLVEHVDIFPTVFDLVGGKSDYPKQIQGKSLIPYIFVTSDSPTEIEDYKKEYAFSQRRFYDPPNLTEMDDGVGSKQEREIGEKYTIQTERFKYIYSTHGMDEFFNLESDPYECSNLLAGEELPPSATKLKRLLLKKVNLLKKQTPSRPLTVDRETIERLKSMGYIQ